MLTETKKEVYAVAGDYVLIRPDREDSHSPGGIALPDSVRESKNTGVLLAVGVGSWNEQHFKRNPMPFHPGDRVLYSSMAAAVSESVEIDGVECVVLPQGNILAVIFTERENE